MERMEKSGHRIVRCLQPTGRVLEPPGACDGAGSPPQRPGWRWCWCKSFGVETFFSKAGGWCCCWCWSFVGGGGVHHSTLCTWASWVRCPGNECVTAAAHVGCTGDSFLHLPLPPYCPFCARHRHLESRLTQQLGSTVAFTASSPIQAFPSRPPVGFYLPPT